MNARHKARMWVVQFLFQTDFNPPDSLDYALERFWEEIQPSENMKGFAERLLREVIANQKEIDAKISGYADNWSIKRLNAVDRNVLRLALHEIFNRPDIPPVVSINEAVELAKDLSSDESGKFVNGILDRAAKDAGRPLRTAGKKAKD
ncbi:MAG: transcription antitermination factor NusB [Kiritimatiellia bacterium]